MHIHTHTSKELTVMRYQSTPIQNHVQIHQNKINTKHIHAHQNIQQDIQHEPKCKNQKLVNHQLVFNNNSQKQKNIILVINTLHYFFFLHCIL